MLLRCRVDLSLIVSLALLSNITNVIKMVVALYLIVSLFLLANRDNDISTVSCGDDRAVMVCNGASLCLRALYKRQGLHSNACTSQARRSLWERLKERSLVLRFSSWSPHRGARHGAEGPCILPVDWDLMLILPPALWLCLWGFCGV